MLKRTLGLTALLMALVLGGTPDATAQQQPEQPRIGYTNQEAILANMPQMEQVQQQLQQAAQTMRESLQTEQQELQEMIAQYQKQQALLSEERRAEREQQLRQRQQELQQSAQQRQQQLAQREAELMQPLLERLQTALNEVAQEENLDVILRTQALLYVNEETIVDVTPLVAQKLGIELQPAEAGPSVENVNTPADPNGGNQ